MLTATLLSLAPLVLAAPPMDDARVKREADAWHAQRLERLRAEDGWLTLVNLAWLEEGETKVGSHPDSGVRLPSSAPERLGTLHRQGATVHFTPSTNLQTPLQTPVGPFTGGVVWSEGSEAPVVLQHGAIRFHVLPRGDRMGVRVKDAQARTRTAFTGIARFEPKAVWRKEARWEPAKEGETIRIPSVIGGENESPLAGTAVFTHGGQEHRLRATREGDQLFFVFGDPTNRDETYGAGRFLYTPLPEEGRVVLDFNRAYNPPCAFTAFATCPLPPKGNRLKVRVEAGEKRYPGGPK